jgi:hypothetical protein
MPDSSAAAGPGPEEVTPETDLAADADETTEDAEAAEAADTEPAFMNRAARRAHAKSATPQRSQGMTPQFGRKGTVQGPRQWGNRRSG